MSLSVSLAGTRPKREEPNESFGSFPGDERSSRACRGSGLNIPVTVRRGERFEHVLGGPYGLRRKSVEIGSCTRRYIVAGR